jgi:hypothetical protein
MKSKEELSEQDSLKLITDMIQKVKYSYHETGVSSLLWGSTIFIASFVSFLRLQFDFKLPFDIWLIALVAIIPQVIISAKEGRSKKFTSHEGKAISWVWITFAITLFGLIAFQIIVPRASGSLIEGEGWQVVKHYTAGNKPDEVIRPFLLSTTSLFILIYAFPTLVTGVVYKCYSMVVGAILAYIFFIISCFTHVKIDFLLAAATALSCWFIPGVILRMRYLKLKKENV